jgi:NADH-quinone oxidoreductase subunit N
MEVVTSMDLQLALPLFIVVGTGLLLMLLDALGFRFLLIPVSALGYLLGIYYSGLNVPLSPQCGFSDMIWFGGFYSLFFIFFLLIGLFLLFFANEYMSRVMRMVVGDIYSLAAFAISGMYLLVAANDLIITFIGLEIMSVAFYIFAGSWKTSLRSNESALKYFLLGAFSSGFLVMGIAFLYGASGTTNIQQITENYLNQSENYLNQSLLSQKVFWLGLILLTVGFFFKVAIFPFHAWSPDAYSGAPTPFVSFLVGGGKLATFLTLGYLSVKWFALNKEIFQPILVVLAVASMVYGNYVALQQRNLKRILAYSSIAHAGYVLLGMAVMDQEAYWSIAFYMIVYMMMTFGSFGLISALQSSEEDEELDAWKGIGLKKPFVGFLMAILMFSLAGIPPFAGFIAKYWIFLVAIKNQLIVPAIIGILTSVVAAYYYLRVLVVMFFYQEEEEHLVTQPGIASLLGVLFVAILVTGLGIFPMLIYNKIEHLVRISFNCV